MKKTIKIIDLLNKIANDEEVPKKIKYKDYEYCYCDDLKDYKNEQVAFRDYLIADRYHSANWLTDEVEIIEEDKKIDYCKSYECFEGLDDYIEHLRGKIDNLIDAINELKKDK